LLGAAVEAVLHVVPGREVLACPIGKHNVVAVVVVDVQLKYVRPQRDWDRSLLLTICFAPFTHAVELPWQYAGGFGAARVLARALFQPVTWQRYGSMYMFGAPHPFGTHPQAQMHPPGGQGGMAAGTWKEAARSNGVLGATVKTTRFCSFTRVMSFVYEMANAEPAASVLLRVWRFGIVMQLPLAKLPYVLMS
jgi:hypothetical protein